MKHSKLTLDEIIQKVIAFNKERGWLGLDAADLAKSIVLEAAELLEHYQWDNTAEKKRQKQKVKNKEAIADEAADVFLYLLQFCYENNIDLLDVTQRKVKKNGKKYPLGTHRQK